MLVGGIVEQSAEPFRGAHGNERVRAPLPDAAHHLALLRHEAGDEQHRVPRVVITGGNGTCNVDARKAGLAAQLAGDAAGLRVKIDARHLHAGADVQDDGTERQRPRPDKRDALLFVQCKIKRQVAQLGPNEVPVAVPVDEVPEIGGRQAGARAERLAPAPLHLAFRERKLLQQLAPHGLHIGIVEHRVGIALRALLHDAAHQGRKRRADPRIARREIALAAERLVRRQDTRDEIFLRHRNGSLVKI
jgi:hypothetical protein